MMRFVVFLSALLFLLGQSHAQRVSSEKDKTVIEIPTPPNGVHLYDNVFIDETEIANIHYLEYLYYIAKDSTHDFYTSQLPDSSAWQVAMQPKDSLDSKLMNYMNYPGFRYFPVVGVTYEQAVNYCRWRGAAVTTFYREKQKEKKFVRKNPGFKNYDFWIEYRLPTKSEWEFAAGISSVKSFPYGTKRPANFGSKEKHPDDACLEKYYIDKKKKENLHQIEFNVVDDFYFDVAGPTLVCNDGVTPTPQYIYAFPPNVRGLYNMIGNVAEMVSEKGIAKGGSFRNRLSDITIEGDLLYKRQNEALGFRCIAVVHFRKR